MIGFTSKINIELPFRTVSCVIGFSWSVQQKYLTLERPYVFLEPGFHTIHSDARIVSVAEFFCHGNISLTIVLNDPYVRSDLIVPMELCPVLASQSRDKKLCNRDDAYVRDYKNGFIV